MELRSLRSPNLSSFPRSGSILKPFIHGQIIKLLNTKKHPEAKNLKLLDCRVRASGTTRSSSETVALPKTVVSKDENLAFVAGATGKVGSRAVRELLKLGFNVRAGVRSTQRAESLVKSVQQMTLDKGAIPAIEKLEIVVCDLERREQIGPALGNASIVLCCIGASEKEVLDVTGPYRIDYQASKNLIDAATIAKVNHFILLTSLGTNKVGFPAAILNLFWGVLIWKRKAEEALLASGIPYTIVRPGGMERPTDSYKETHNISLSKEDTLFGGQVSNLQVAELMAIMAKNRSLSYCKVVEVIAETTAPLTPMGDLLAKIPSQRVDDNPLKDPEDADEIEPAVSSAEAPKPSTEKEPTQAKATATRPLSPYIAYENLKPPSSPSPTPSGPGEILSSNTTPTEVAPEFNTGNDAAKSEAAGDVVKDAPQASTFFHSPYHVYDDFKPPTSPSPSSPSISLPSTSSGNGAMSGNSTAQSSTADIIEVKEHHTAPKPMTLSPFTIYEDLKPPSSPCPTPSGPGEILSSNSTPTEVAPEFHTCNDAAKTKAADDVVKDAPQASTFFHSPYHVYDDFKPPTSPSPSSPSISLPSTSLVNGAMSGNSTAQSSTADIIEVKEHHTAPKPMTLSPFTMYEDLKPPTSPTPSPPK